MATAKSPYFDMLLGTIETFNRCTNSDEVAQHLICLSSRLGYEFAAYIDSAAKNCSFKSRLILGNWPKGWVDQYTQPGWNQYDRVAHALRANKRAFTWSSVQIRNDDKKARRVMDTAARDFGMRSGVCGPIHGRGGYQSGFSFSGFGADQSEDAVGVLQLSSYYAESRFQHLRTDAPQPKQLTQREKEVLTWAAAGKSAWDTGVILNIAEGTVSTMLKNAMGKLNAHNKAQAVAKAIRMGELGE
jgi:LuxR family transcriptional regulator, quorum-sensing system regulator BjaR1